MTDYKEEQNGEIEALESIYSDELDVIETSPFHIFTVTVTSQSSDEAVPVGSCVIQFTYTPKYPEEAPAVEISEFEGIEQNHADDILDLIKEEAAENLGMVMVFTLVSAVQEKLSDLVEQIELEKKNEVERRLKEVEAAEQKKFEGVRVTVDSFLAWKAKFDAEMAEIKRRAGEKKVDCKKLTGKDLFMRDASLDNSDVKFLEEVGDTVQVDESLFQDMEDLDIDEDEFS
uniref:RWD domain-containing protein 1 n=1 Tax=Urechis unicinctus TaxID=6432 RepID=A0A3Q8U6P6_UREUN|nr:RWD domain-containing protein 1 [Urechis unicinctus]